MSKHTPGEWRIAGPFYVPTRPDRSGDYAILVNSRIIAEVFYMTSHTDFEPAEANAHLIAAAPELLASLVECYALLSTIDCKIPDEQYGVITRAADAIAKAEGK